MWRERKEGRKEEEEVAFPIKGAEKGGGCRDVAGEEAEDRVSQQCGFVLCTFLRDFFWAATFGAVRRTRHSCAAVCVGGGGGGGGGWQRPEV